MKTKNENKQEIICYLYELLRYVQYEINVVKKLCEEECSLLEAGRRKGRLETLESMLEHINKIVEKYFETHNNNNNNNDNLKTTEQ